MRKVNRRKMLTSLGVRGGTAVLSGCGESTIGPSVVLAEALNTPNNSPSSSPPHWEYSKIDPDVVAQRAYDIYPEGGCMYAVVGSVIGTLADEFGEPYQSFPIGMMRFGEGGVGAWGSLCGVVNGAAALIGLFHSEEAKEEREALITELGVWYEASPLPEFKPSKPGWADETEASVAGSLLCHVSVTKWCEASSCEAFSTEKKERCRRLAADGARKVVQLLNRHADGDWIEGELTPDVYSCVDCHGKKAQGDAMVRMNCTTCHQFEAKHP